MVKSNQGETNIFNISDAEAYRCQILHYHNRLSRLYIAVFKGQDRASAPIFYLLFSDVAYFECPVTWQGADFSIAPSDDCIQLMLDTGLIGEAILRFPNAYASITDYAHLYLAQTSLDKEIRIIASSANMLHELPSDLA
ncbi:MAG: hypothetical protein Phog2KO_37360 [Phototrophicaceae bacterium]